MNLQLDNFQAAIIRVEGGVGCQLSTTDAHDGSPVSYNTAVFVVF